MNITYLIGNGFDIHLGLKTKYTDFYPIYIENNKNTKNPIIDDFCTVIEEDFENWSDFEAAFPNYVETAEEVEVALRNFTVQFADYLRSQTFEKSYANLSKYVSDFQDFIFYGFKKLPLKREREEIFNILLDIPDKMLNINFINFNYTDTLSILGAEHLPNNISSSICHIHGFIDDYIIIGIDDDSQLIHLTESDRNGIDKYCVKKAINSLAKNDIEQNFSRIIENSELIFTYGLSFGDSDRSRWNVVKKWFLDSTIQGIIVVYQYKPIFSNHRPQYLPSFLPLYEEAKVNFLIECLNVPKSDITDDLISRVMIIDSDEVLNFKLVDEGGADNTSPNERNEILNP